MADDIGEDDLLGFEDDGHPKPMTLANAIQVWSLRQPITVTVDDAALAFLVTPAKVREAVEMHYWMFLTGAAGDEIEHEGE